MKKTLLLIVSCCVIFGCDHQVEQTPTPSTDEEPYSLEDITKSGHQNMLITYDENRFNQDEQSTIWVYFPTNNLIAIGVKYYETTVWVDGTAFNWQKPDISPGKVFVYHGPGPTDLSKTGFIGHPLPLRSWGVTDAVLSSGKHELVVTWEKESSNKLEITVE